MTDEELNYEEVVGVEVIEEDPRLFFETPFNDYTVTEGLLLIIVMLLFVSACIRVVKEGFSWL